MNIDFIWQNKSQVELAALGKLEAPDYTADGINKHSKPSYATLQQKKGNREEWPQGCGEYARNGHARIGNMTKLPHGDG